MVAILSRSQCDKKCKAEMIILVLTAWHLEQKDNVAPWWPLLLTLINFNPGMDA